MSLFDAANEAIVVLLVGAVCWMNLVTATALPNLTNPSSSPAAAAAATATVYCGSYCDANGAVHPRAPCISGFQICCGTVHRRYCCNIDDADHESFAAADLLAADDSTSCVDAAPAVAVPDPGMAAAAAVNDQTVNATSRMTTSSQFYVTTFSPNNCGKFCDLYNQQYDRQLCTLNGMVCCGTLNNRFCCLKPEGDPSLSIDDICTTDTWQFLLQWWYIVVPTVLILILLLTMVLCYACRYQCWSNQRRSAAGNGRDGDVALEPASLRDFDPTSMYAFQPPPYDSLPKDPPTYSEVVASDADPAAVVHDNTAFVADDGRAPTAVPGDGSPSAPVAAATAPSSVGNVGVSSQPVSHRPAVAIPNQTPVLLQPNVVEQPTRPAVLPDPDYDTILPHSPPIYEEIATTENAAASTVAAVSGRNDVGRHRRRHRRDRTRNVRDSRARGPTTDAPPSYGVVVNSTDTAAAAAAARV